MATGVFLNDAGVTAIGVSSVSGANDYFPVHDASATQLKKIVASDVLKRLLSSADVSWMSALANLAAIDATNDKFLVWDADATAIKTLAATQILDRLLTTLDISALSSMSSIGSIDPVNDRFMFWDNSAGGTGQFVVLTAGEITTRLWRGHGHDMTSTPYAIAATDVGKHYSNTGTSTAVTVQLPAATAGLRFAFTRVAAYDITLDPNGSETINGGDTYTMSGTGRVDIECFVNGAWVITSNSTASSAASVSGTYNVRTYGAIGNFSTNCTSAFQAAAALCLTKTSRILVPESTEATTPGYRVNTGNYLSALGTAANAQPGGVTDLRGRIGFETGPLILPNGHQVIGVVADIRNDASPMASEIWATSGYSGTNNRLVQLGRDDYLASDALPDTTRLEKLTVNGRSVASVVGVYSNSLQERSGLFDCVVRGCHSGILFAAGANVGPANFAIERTDVVAVTANSGNGIDIYGNQYRVIKCTVVNRHTTTNGDTAFVLRGRNATLQHCHFEGYDFGVDIGGPDTGVGGDTGLWTRNITVDGLTGYNLQTGGYSHPNMTAMVRIRNDDTHVFNVSIRNLSLNLLNGTSYLVQDDVNGIVIPADATSLNLAHYEFGGSYTVDSGSAVKRPVYTSYYNRLGAANAAVMAAAVTGTTDDLPTTFASGAQAGILQITSTSTPILTSMTAGRTGRVVYGHNLTGSTLVLDHAAGSGTAANKFLCSTSADINVAVGGYFRATYGDILGAAIDGSNYASRWYVEAV